MKRAFESYLRHFEIKEKVTDLYQEQIGHYMEEHYPRFYEFVEMFGSPVDMVSLKPEVANLAATSANIKLVSHIPAT